MPAPATAAVPRGPWILLVLGLVVFAGLLLGPLWSTAEGENPLQRSPDPDYGAVLALSLPTLAMAVLVVLALGWARLARRSKVQVSAD